MLVLERGANVLFVPAFGSKSALLKWAKCHLVVLVLCRGVTQAQSWFYLLKCCLKLEVPTAEPCTNCSKVIHPQRLTSSWDCSTHPLFRMGVSAYFSEPNSCSCNELHWQRSMQAGQGGTETVSVLVNCFYLLLMPQLSLLAAVLPLFWNHCWARGIWTSFLGSCGAHHLLSKGSGTGCSLSMSPWYNG